MDTTRYVWDWASDAVLMEVNNLSATQSAYTNEPARYGGLVSQRRADAVSYYQFDGRSATTELTSSSQDTTDTYTYSGFGETVSRQGITDNPFTYIGWLGYYSGEREQSIYVRARHYSPLLARWSSLDPVEHKERYKERSGVVSFEDVVHTRARDVLRWAHLGRNASSSVAGTVQSHRTLDGVGRSLYEYSMNNPIHLADPSGLCTIELLCWPAFPNVFPNVSFYHCEYRITASAGPTGRCRGESKPCTSTLKAICCWPNKCIGATWRPATPLPDTATVYETITVGEEVCECLRATCLAYPAKFCYNVNPQQTEYTGNSNTAAYCLNEKCAMGFADPGAGDITFNTPGWPTTLACRW